MNKIHLIAVCFLAGGSAVLHTMDSDDEHYDERTSLLVSQKAASNRKSEEIITGDYSGGDFRGKNFDGKVIEKLIAHDADFSGASFKGACLVDVKGNNVNFSGADFTGACLNGVIFTRSTFNEATWKNFRLENSEIIASYLHNITCLRATFLNSTINGTLRSSKLSSIQCTNVKFLFSKFDHAKIINSFFTNCDFEGTKGKRCKITGSCIEGTLLSGREGWEKATFNNVQEIQDDKKETVR